ncbi:MAG: hypothetical protein C0596_08595 [Marinilabiliales bacterium]|nr:MAG: hypothetical protein C0596_08595 [Marinilabiliales bacterium]
MYKYTMKDINVGDGVYFKLEYQSNYDLFWTVISKKEPDILEIEINKMGANDRIFLKIEDVHSLEKRT